MTVKEFLSQAFYLDRAIKAKQIQIQKLRDMQQSVGFMSTGDRVQSSGEKDKIADVTAKLIDAEKEYLDDINRLTAVKLHISFVINKVDNLLYRAVLENRYLNLMTWEKIAVEMGYSWRSIHYLHGRALTEVEDCIVLHTLDMI